ncbi:HlyD family secretion protein [Shewanella sp. GXUN23E]|uniref:HlyD family secretion protein n=1 Tax=Shewanella sp. GXUN23E TaxID=3422498 RepID=UPI003D7E2DB0
MTETTDAKPEVNSKDKPDASKDKSEGTSQARKFTYYIFLAVLCLWLYTLWTDRMTPMTDEGRVNGQIVRITPQISGPISQVLVTDNTEVDRGQPLVVIEKHPFELNVKAAKLALQQTTQSFHADSAAIDAAKATEVAARVKVDNARQHFERYQELAKSGLVSQADLDDSAASLETAQANLNQATAALEKAKQELGPQTENNPQIQSALNKLEQALLDLSYTDINAPGKGVITNMNLAAGNYASNGQPLMTFVNNQHLWVTAMVTENSLAHLKKGIPVKLVFDAYPGQIFTGEVTTIGWGSSGNGGLQVDNSNGLLNSPTSSPDAQRFPVNVKLDPLPEGVDLRYSGRVTVSFYPGESYIGERLLDVWTWIWSYLTYVS